MSEWEIKHLQHRLDNQEKSLNSQGDHTET